MNIDLKIFDSVNTFNDKTQIKTKILKWLFDLCSLSQYMFQYSFRNNWIIVSIYDDISIILDQRNENCELIEVSLPEKYWSRYGMKSKDYNGDGQRVKNSVTIPLDFLNINYPKIIKSKLVDTHRIKESGEPDLLIYTFHNYLDDGNIIVSTSEKINEPINDYIFKAKINEREFIKYIQENYQY